MVPMSAKKACRPSDTFVILQYYHGNRAVQILAILFLFFYHSSAAKPNLDKRSKVARLNFACVLGEIDFGPNSFQNQENSLLGRYSLLGLSEWYLVLSLILANCPKICF